MSFFSKIRLGMQTVKLLLYLVKISFGKPYLVVPNVGIFIYVDF